MLVVEDDPETRAFLEQGLTDAGHLVAARPTGVTGLSHAIEETFDLLVVDRMLPDLDGLSLVKALRAAGSDTPVLMLTAMGAISDRVEGLEAGADDYVVKPFSLSELQARVAALGRRQRQNSGALELVVGDLRLDRLKRQVWRGEREIELQPREFQLLELLMLHAGRVLTRTMILEKVWEIHFDPNTNIVEAHISRIRSKIDRGDDPPLIHTLRGAGYVIRAQ